MGIESSCVFLSAKLCTQGKFVHNPTYLKGVQAVLEEYGLAIPRFAQGILIASIGGQKLPVAVVDSEEIFQSVNPLHRKYKVGGMTPAELYQERLVLIDGNWANDALAADVVLQSLFFLNRYNRHIQEVNFTGIPNIAAKATSRFLTQDLFEQYRGRYLDWLEQGI